LFHTITTTGFNPFCPSEEGETVHLWSFHRI
jgi:hypothetical protein